MWMWAVIAAVAVVAYYGYTKGWFSGMFGGDA